MKKKLKPTEGKYGVTNYKYEDAKLNDSHNFLLPKVYKILNKIHLPNYKKSLFDLGCGNGSVANLLTKQGWYVVGVDASSEGIREAKIAYPNLKLHYGSAYDDLGAIYGKFPIVLSLEVIEHIYSPRDYLKTIYDLLEKKGKVIISTPYHGYLKNLALAVTGKMDAHFTTLWDGGHIKFWSIKTISTILKEVGFTDLKFEFAGRCWGGPLFAKSMIVIGYK
jgi:2-polyprenyl-6-hydroxyphenyl methylase/3-demethylubiquinone-9 3-methyltransferase